MSDKQIHDFIAAAGALVEAAIQPIKRTQPDDYEGLRMCLKVGGMVSLRATFAPSTGLAQLAVDIIEPSGQTHCLMTTSLERAGLNN